MSSKLEQGNDVMELLHSDRCVTFLAPMVRYSQLPFRLLCRHWGVDVAFSPMIIAKSFNISEKAREASFSTSKEDYPLIVQFAASDDIDFGEAAKKVANVCSGVDLNCGCPQSWVIKDGLGCALKNDPDLVCACVKKARDLCGDHLAVSVKFRIDKDLSQTIEFMRRAEKAGASFVTVHGRTKSMKSSEPAHWNDIGILKEHAHIPVILNGGVSTHDDMLNAVEATGVDGVMSARGLIENPALFLGEKTTPLPCFGEYLETAISYGTPYTIMRYHVAHMTTGLLTKKEKQELHEASSTVELVNVLNKKLGEKVGYELGENVAKCLLKSLK